MSLLFTHDDDTITSLAIMVPIRFCIAQDSPSVGRSSSFQSNGPMTNISYQALWLQLLMDYSVILKLSELRKPITRSTATRSSLRLLSPWQTIKHVETTILRKHSVNLNNEGVCIIIIIITLSQYELWRLYLRWSSQEWRWSNYQFVCIHVNNSLRRYNKSPFESSTVVRFHLYVCLWLVIKVWRFGRSQ